MFKVGDVLALANDWRTTKLTGTVIHVYKQAIFRMGV